ncbi:MAG: sodium:proton antiporter [Acidobacteriota bacterium]|nr:sodium:proton antiporter [Acidobacteriota bacterium]
MDFLGWMAIAGGLLLLMALSSAYISRLPISTSAIYLLVGIALSPLGFDLLRINVIESRVWLEHLTEVAVIISLFIGGLKLRLPFLDPAWSAAYRLAGPVMLFSIICVAAFTHLVFGLNLGVAFLLGAVLAPTDPVLASAVAVSDSKDNDRMRYGLSGEAGLNDGAAFPFVIFGLLWIENSGAGNWIGGWALHRILWAVPAGLLLGYFLGKGVGRFAIWLRKQHKDAEAPNDFLALSLIALSYVGAETIYAWGFLATFAAGVGLRHAEIKVVEENPLPDSEIETDDSQAPHPPAEEVVGANLDEEDLQKPAVAAGVVVSEIISFGDTAERILEVLLVVLVGICVAVHWDWRAVPLALVFFFVIRPLFAQLFLFKTPTDNIQRWLLGWFGIRGIGSLYYLSYALNHGLTTQAEDAVALTISVVAISILLHGIMATPILNYYERKISENSK